MAHLFSLWHLYTVNDRLEFFKVMSTVPCLATIVLNDPLFTTGYQMTPSLADFFLPQ